MERNIAIDFWKIYKAFIQREKRYPRYEPYVLIRSKMRLLMEEGRTTEERLQIAREIKRLEQRSGNRKIYADDLIRGLESENYFIEIPFPVQHKRREKEDDKGFFYVGVSKSKPGQLKIGATTLSPYTRAVKYSSKFGYQLTIAWYSYVTKPYSKEARMKQLLQSKRVSGLTEGDSNEWYRGTVEVVINLFNLELKNLGKDL